MKAVVLHEFGGPGILTYERIPNPEPGSGEVRIRVEAAGLNFIDLYQRSGLYQVPLPAVLGMEAAEAHRYMQERKTKGRVLLVR